MDPHHSYMDYFWRSTIGFPSESLMAGDLHRVPTFDLWPYSLVGGDHKDDLIPLTYLKKNPQTQQISPPSPWERQQQHNHHHQQQQFSLSSTPSISSAPSSPSDLDAAAKVLRETPVLQAKFLQTSTVEKTRKRTIHRKEQNRRAQRAFRERKEKRIADLERQLLYMTSEVDRVRQAYDELRRACGPEGATATAPLPPRVESLDARESPLPLPSSSHDETYSLTLFDIRDAAEGECVT